MELGFAVVDSALLVMAALGLLVIAHFVNTKQQVPGKVRHTAIILAVAAFAANMVTAFVYPEWLTNWGYSEQQQVTFPQIPMTGTLGLALFLAFVEMFVAALYGDKDN